jgi:tungstate transport system substrate-binding protein
MRNINRVVATAVIALVYIALQSGIASADSPTTLTVIGTSDVSDSGLFQNVIAPQFEAAYPQYKIQYFGTASGTAITDAENGAAVSGGASVLLVHAASLENQFVSGGYSYANQPGFAVFRNDFVLAGPASDPAGVATNAANNAAQAFVDIANEGYNGGAAPPAPITFVSRGGTPGTTVEEHEIWQLVDTTGLRPSTLTLCTVSSTDGGGETPIANGLDNVSSEPFTDGEACTDLPSGDLLSGLPNGPGLPDWYVTTADNQGANVLAADSCTTFTGVGTCYVFSDRGTVDYLSSGEDPAGKLVNLKILARNNSASAPGGAYVLINYFHAYIINQATVQAKTGSGAPTVNLPAAQDFITLVTSPAFQASLQNYLAWTGATTSNLTSGGALDSSGPPFIGDASPQITDTGLTGTYAYGSPVTVTGTLTNPEPGYPVLAGQTVTVDQLVAGIPVPVATGTTNASGVFTTSFKAAASGEYQVQTGQLTQLENATLSPTFSDTFAPAASALSTITVSSPPAPIIGATAAKTVKFSKVTITKKGAASVSGKLSPAPTAKGATVELFAINLNTGKEKEIGHVAIKAGKNSFTVKGKLALHTGYLLQLAFVQKGQSSLYSALKKARVK